MPPPRDGHTTPAPFPSSGLLPTPASERRQRCPGGGSEASWPTPLATCPPHRPPEERLPTGPTRPTAAAPDPGQDGLVGACPARQVVAVTVRAAPGRRRRGCPAVRCAAAVARVARTAPVT